MKRLICLGLIIFIILCGCQDNKQQGEGQKEENVVSVDITTDSIKSPSAEPNAIYFVVEMTDDVWNSAVMKDSRFQNKEEFISEVENYIEEISNFLGKENWYEAYREKHGEDYICHIDYRLTPGVSHVEGGYQAYSSLIPNVYLKADFFEHDLAPMAHETTHIIVPYYSSLSLREGLASYCQDKFGKNPTVFNWGVDVHTYSKLYLIHTQEEFNKVFPVVGTTDTLQNTYAQGDLREVLYNLSHSFVKFLIESYGIDKFMKLYESKDLINDYTFIYEKSFEVIKEEWRESLEFYKDTMTIEELQEHMDELLEGHNYSFQ